MLVKILAVLFFHVAAAFASPTPRFWRPGSIISSISSWFNRANHPKITALTRSQIASFRPYTLFARAAYCPASNTRTWSCGRACKDLPGFIPYASGGDGVTTPFWFVGYYPKLKSVIVSNQGTDPRRIIPLLIDSNVWLSVLSNVLFPGISASIRTHRGFQNAQGRSAKEKLAAIKRAMAQKNTTRVAFTGHSLGGAISLIDAVYLSINLPKAKIKVVTYGMPRVGNSAFAAFVDSKIKDLSHINNEKDFVPIIPGLFMGFAHPSGEKHILSPGVWVACAGRDNNDASCSTGMVPSLLSGDVFDHNTYYEGITINDCS